MTLRISIPVTCALLLLAAGCALDTYPRSRNYQAPKDGGPVVPPLSGGGVSQSQHYRLRHTVGMFGPTHTLTSGGVTASAHFHLTNVLNGPAH